MHNAITGINDYLLAHLQRSLEKAKEIRIIVAFLMESGAKLIADQLAAAARRGVPIKILTGTYLSVTEPSAIYYLKSRLGPAMEIRFYKDLIRSFHPKAYIFEHDDDGEIYIGSSNLSKAALTDGVEWNYRLTRSSAPEDFEKFLRTFDELFAYHSYVVDEETLKRYAVSWRKPRLTREESPGTLEPAERPQPFGAQIEALYYLEQARAEGLTKGLVIAATGVGKTYLAAFDSVKFKRVLFVAHREEILQQAREAFSKVRPKSSSGFFTGREKELNVDLCFATIQTLSREEHLRSFPPDHFDYIVVDEFHHAAAGSYRRLLEYFQPRFLLGLTATPYRTDNRDIFALCDDNVIYEIHLKDSINRDLLVPFVYYGVYDPTDYEKITVRNGQYVVEELERALARKERADLVLEKYRAFAKAKTLGFCVNIGHAEYMAEYFSKHGVPALAVHSGDPASPYAGDRREAVTALEKGEIKVIFAVDIFNEGVDIPALDTVMFLRPTESLTVFLQQLGRGLRKAPGKTHLVVLDFIGNYKRAHWIPALLAGESPEQGAASGRRVGELEYPEGCQVHFDFEVLDLFQEMAARDPLAKRMRDEFFRLRDELGRRPTRLQMYTGTDLPFREFLKEGWLRFLDSVGALTEEEKGWLGTPAEEFLREVEKTAFTKAYKLPTLRALLTGEGGIRPSVSLQEIDEEFIRFYHENPLHQRDLRDKSNRNWRSWGVAEFADLARRNPVHFLTKGSPFFHYDEINRVFWLDGRLRPYLTASLAGHLRDILEYRRVDFFRKRYREDR